MRHLTILPIFIGGKWGYVKVDHGTVIIAPTYDYAGRFSDGRAVVGRNGVYGFIDLDGNEIVEIQFGSLAAYSEGLARAKVGKYSGYINFDGQLTIPARFGYCGSFAQGVANVSDRTAEELLIGLRSQSQISDHYFINKDGLDAGFGRYLACQSFVGGVAWVRDKEGWMGINVQGSVVIEQRFDVASSFSEGLAYVSGISAEKWEYGVFIRKDGMPQFGSPGFLVFPFSEGLAAVSRNYEVGFIDQYGRIAIDFQFDKVLPFRCGVAPVRIDGLWGAIDRSAQLIIKPMFDDLGMFEDGAAYYKRKEKNGYIAPDGAILVEI